MTGQTLQFELVAAFVGFLTLIILYIAYRLLSSSGWVMGWIQGNLGLALLLSTGVLVLAVMDIRTYQPMFNNVAIGTLSLHTLGPGKHQIRLVNSKGVEQSYSFSGDQYQLEINQLQWGIRFTGMGLGHGYRIRDLLIKGTDDGASSSVVISRSDYVDVWAFIHDYLPQGLLVSPTVVKTLPRSVVDGAMYELIPDGLDIQVVPLNQIAKEAEQAGVHVASPVSAAVPESPVTESMPAASGISPDAVNLTHAAQSSDSKNTPPKMETVAPASEIPPAQDKASTVTQGKIIRVPPPNKVEELPGAHLQATPATVIDKSTVAP